MSNRSSFSNSKSSSSLSSLQKTDFEENNALCSGLYLFGQVIDRTRRTIQTRNNTSAEILTYTIRDICDRRYYVDEYSPSSYFEVNKYVEIPVYVKVFQKRNGEIAYSFCVQQKLASSRGEHF